MPVRTQQELDNLLKIYRNARDQLLDTIINFNGVGTKTYANTILKQVEKQLEELERATGQYAGSVIPAEYKKALNEIYAYFTRNNLMMKSPEHFALLHNDAIYAIAREMQYQIGQGLEQVGRQILRYVETARDNALRMAGLEATGEKLASGSTIRQMKDNLIKKLQEEGFMTVQYGQGENAYQVSLDSYASMVARSTTREAGNIARENQLTANGYDLVKMTTHYPTCHICTQFQGRVYSITGKDKRFPPLSRAFANGYHNIHPNCRHSVHPWIEELREPEEVQQAIAESNRPFKDDRDQKQIDLYNKQQKQNRQMRQDRYQYERYKARLGEDAPKTFSAFRRMKKAGGEAWEDLRCYYKHKGDRPTHCVKIDRELEKLGVNKGKAYPAENDIEVKSWRPHAENRLKRLGYQRTRLYNGKKRQKSCCVNIPKVKHS
ncbi:MAG TPA: hypothetical protein PLZ84_00755 [Clostridia bacterium]|nr:hypothetical protein [Clostridia bacterium]